MNPVLYIILGGCGILSIAVLACIYFLFRPITKIPFMYDKSPGAVKRLTRDPLKKPQDDKN